MSEAPIPVRPTASPISLGRAIPRAVYAVAAWRASPTADGPAAFVPGDQSFSRIARHLARSAVSGAVTSDDSWAGALVPTATSLFLGEILGSAAAGLIAAAGGPIPLASEARISIPGI